MAYAAKDGKDTVLFVDKEYVDQQPDIEPPKSNDDSNEKDQAAAYDPETGEINWECPCLGGMAQGPCGEEFKAAFSCFVYSNAEPKGVDCVDKFRDMQNCFRQHPDVYGDEIDDDDDEDEVVEEKKSAEPAASSSSEEKETPKEEESSSSSNVVASSVLEEGESSSFSSWVSSWF
ncbi:hypothetical protein BDA99DRAFT_497201 [Phascolomyces articulosus]|uniref:Mitochondrial intermembrane space import and assembly protein 40 n=1 Tax=Phascolomyces articulosus TaxID=60185 RepID=A0AAD5KJL1_9FUNG|nr:hypothetical protein BDA99DRAFT_497201 [Phascolomyces articulosus]